MQKLLLQILLAVFTAFVIFFAYSAYQYYVALHSDDPVVPYVFVEKWAATVVRGELAIDMTAGEQYDLSAEDTIITKKDTLAIVTWPDRSQTRLWASSRMRIDRMIVAVDYSSIEIEFALEEGQAWSTVVRTIYPGSYFRTRIPGQGVIAWVRGTVYDIDLVRGYIRSIDHSVALTDSLGRGASLLPGELVSVKNILQKLTTSVVDSTWVLVNTTHDRLFLDTRAEALRTQVDMLSGKTSGLWDRFVRWLLSFLPTFSDLAVLEWLLSDVPGFDQVKIPKEKILGLYQKLQDTKFVQERDKIRTYIESQKSTLALTPEYIQTLTRSALWDQMASSGITLAWAQSMVKGYVQGLDTQMRGVLQVVPVQDLGTKARETLRQLVK